jgi:glutamate formiminotransferase
VGEELRLPAFLYGESGGGRRPAFYRRGGPEELQRRVDAGELAPAFGPRRLDDAAGAVLVGARKLLVAFNVELATSDLEIARAVAASVRETSGGIRGVQALGLRLGTTGNAQVSMNIVDIELAHLHEVVARVREEAAARGVAVVRGERVGLLPAVVVQRAAGAPAGELPTRETLTAAAAALALDSLPASGVLELQLREHGLL